MNLEFLHKHQNFKDLINIVADELSIDPFLIEKDYWIMHSLYSLQQEAFKFELKGGTSLSKAFKIIDRFSEDIDIHIHPDPSLKINENPKNTNENNIKKRIDFYNHLADQIKIDGIIEVKRDHTFDDTNLYRSAGIRLYYKSHFSTTTGIKEGILLEVGFDTTSPNTPVDISSWAFDKAYAQNVPVIDNRATQVPCYHIGYTFVEKLQTIATKYRNMISSGDNQLNFMRQYYDVYNLLQQQTVQEFIQTDQYRIHKELRFPKADFDIPLSQNQAFLLEDDTIKDRLKKMYESSKGLYYKGQPDFEVMLNYIKEHLHNL